MIVTSKTGHDPRAYLIKEGKKHWVANGQVLHSLGYTWDKIKKVSAKKIDSYPTSYPYTSAKQTVYETPEFIYCVEETWSDDHSIGVVGWATGKHKILRSLDIEVNGLKKKIEHWVDKPEVYDYYTNNTTYPVQKKCGFQAIIHKDKEHEIKFTPNTKRSSKKLIYSSTRDAEFPEFPTSRDLEKRFRDMVNKQRLKVLEVGSRISPGGINKRTFFKNAKDYVGIDYLPGDTVDVVGDAHELKQHFKKDFDALYSDSVLEHLAMPWKAIIEMNGVLKKGGYVFHSAPSTWIPHDMPWDFWRFSDAGMRALFSEPFGFKVLDVEYTSPVRLHVHSNVGDEYARFPISPAFGFISVLAQKTKDVNPRRIRFNATLKDIVGNSSYPAWTD